MALSRRTFCALVALLAAVATASPHTPAPAPSKLDRALREWVERPTTASVRALVHARPGTGPAVGARLQRLTARMVTASTTADLMVAELSREALLAASADHDIAHFSTDAI